MDEQPTLREISDAVTPLGWRWLQGTVTTSVAASSVADALAAAGIVAEAARPHTDEHVTLDVRRDRLVVAVRTAASHTVTAADVDVVRRVTDALTATGRAPHPGVGGRHAVQAVQFAIDALHIDAVRPFWKAVLGYVDRPSVEGRPNVIVDPHGRQPRFWFQQLDEPRPQRNRLHVDVWVPHDEAERRVAAAVAAGGRVVRDTEAPSFWTLADPEGNEVCVATWQGRD